MPQLFWNPIAANTFVILILQLTIVMYFGKRLIRAVQTQSAIRTHGLLLFTTLSTLFCTGLLFLSYALHADYVDQVLPWITPFGAIASSGFILFAFYLFEQPLASRRWALALFALLAAIIAFETYIAIERWQLLNTGFVEYRAHWSTIPDGLIFLIAHAVLFMHIVKAIQSDRQGGFWASLQCAIIAVCWPFKPISNQASTARAFFYYALMPILLALVLLARDFGWVDWRLAQVIGCWIYLGILAGFVLVYLNYVPEQSSFRVKLIGLTLITVLAISNGVTWLIDPIYTKTYVDDAKIVQHTAIRFLPTKDHGYHVSHLLYQFDAAIGQKVTDTSQPLKLPFKFPFYSATYDKLYAHQDGIVGFDHYPLLRNIQHQYGPQPAIFMLTTALLALNDSNKKQALDSGLYVNASKNLVTLTWYQLVAKHSPSDVYTFQLKLYANGTIDLVFAEVPNKPLHDFYWSDAAPMMTGIVPPLQNRLLKTVQFPNALPFVLAPNMGVIENTRTPFNLYLNAIYQPIAYFILIATLIVLIVFPYFFRVNLDRPLRQLLKGVQEILSGRLNTKIKVSYRDEIGFLANSFNEMAASQAELISSLEDKVAKRTAEASKLAAENARLEERNHLSRELHDTVSQTLFSSNLLAEKIPTLTQQDPEQALQSLTEIQALNRNALLEMRHLLLALNPAKIAPYDFGKLLHDVALETEQKFDCSIKVNVDNDVTLPIDIQLTFYRIAQECLNNAAKHAGTEQLHVYFDGVANQAMLQVSDKGQGFDPKSVPSGHFGLKIMHERMQEIGGSLEVTSEPGKGTSITAIWIKEDDKNDQGISR